MQDLQLNLDGSLGSLSELRVASSATCGQPIIVRRYCSIPCTAVHCVALPKSKPCIRFVVDTYTWRPSPCHVCPAVATHPITPCAPQLTPVAQLEPVEIGGVTIQHVSLHNAGHLREMQLGAGDVVAVERAGDVIPQVNMDGVHFEGLGSKSAGVRLVQGRCSWVPVVWWLWTGPGTSSHRCDTGWGALLRCTATQPAGCRKGECHTVWAVTSVTAYRQPGGAACCEVCRCLQVCSVSPNPP